MAKMYQRNFNKKELKILQLVMSTLILVVSKSNQQIVDLSQTLPEQQQQPDQQSIKNVDIQSSIDGNTLSANLLNLTALSRPACTDLSSNDTGQTISPLTTQRRILKDEAMTSNQNQTEDLLVQESQNNQSVFRFSSLASEQIVDPIRAPISNNNELYKNHNINNSNKNLADLSSRNYDSISNTTTFKLTTSQSEPQYFKPPDEFLANYWLQDNNQLFNRRLPSINESTLKSPTKQYMVSDNQENIQGESNSVALSNLFAPVSYRQVHSNLQNQSNLPTSESTTIPSSNNSDKPDKQSMAMSQPINEPITGTSEHIQGLAKHALSQQQRLLLEQFNLQKINNDLIKLASEQQQKSQQQNQQQQQQHQNYGYQSSKSTATRQAQKVPKIYSHNQIIYPTYLQSLSTQNTLLNPKVKHIQLGRLLPFTNKLRYKKFHYQQTTTGKPLIEDLQTSAHSQDIQLETPRDMVISSSSSSSQQQNNNSPQSNLFTAHPIPLNHQQVTLGGDQLTRLQAKTSNPIFTKYKTLKNLRQAQLQSLTDTIDPSASALLSSASISPVVKSRLQRFESINSQLPAASGFNAQSALEIGDQGPSTMSYSLLPSTDSQSDADSAITGLDQDQFIKVLQQSAALGAPPSIQEVAQDSVGSSDAALASLFETMLKSAINSTNSHKPSDSVQSSPSNNLNQQSAQQQQQQAQTQQNQIQSSSNFLTASQSPITSSKFNMHNNQQQQQMGYPGQLTGSYNHQAGLIPPPPLMGDDPMQQHQHNQLHGPGTPDSLQLADNNLQMYDQMQPTQRKRKKSKKRNKHGVNGPSGHSKQPQIRVAKRPRAGTGNPGFYDVNSQNDLEPSATFHKWKYPWLYGPNAGAFRPGDEDEEEEGETEVNIRFFNNFSRMGPFGQLTRAGGTATLVVSLAFLIISNISLAATVIAHGISSFLRNHGSPDRTKTIVRKRETTAMPAAQKGSDDLSFYSSSANLDSRSSLANDTSSITTTSTTIAPGTDLNEKIKSFGREWEI